MQEYTVHFRKGTRVGARRYRFEHVVAGNAADAEYEAKLLFRDRSFRVCRVDHFEGNSLVIDWES